MAISRAEIRYCAEKPPVRADVQGTNERRKVRNIMEQLLNNLLLIADIFHW